ncbi:MAG: hypothetical protein ACK5XD_08095 [Acidobacteriota bacterium]
MTRHRATYGPPGQSGTLAMDLRYVFTNPSSPNNGRRAPCAKALASPPRASLAYPS